MGQISKPPPPLPQEIDQELASLVMQLLEKDPAKRVQTAAELFARLHAILARIAPNHSALSEVPAGGIMPLPPSVRQPAVPAPSAPLPVVAAPALAAPGVPSSVPMPPATTSAATARGTRRSPVGWVIVLIFLAVVAFAMVRWVVMN
jgi:hypothetical protein